MANQRVLECGKEVLAIGQDGSLADLESKINVCFNCSQYIGCKHSVNMTKVLLATQENLIDLINQIKEEQKLY